MRVSDKLLKDYDRVIEVLNEYGVIETRIFGSVYKNEDTENSDIDLIVDLPNDFTLVMYGKLKYKLEEILGVSIDMLTYKGLNDKTLTHFKANSISIIDFKDEKEKNKEKNTKTKFDSLTSNLNSIVWIIERIKKITTDITKEEILNSILLQDSLTRNIQLLSKVVSQIPKEDLDKLHSDLSETLIGFLPLKEALFMNVDYELMWMTMSEEIAEIQEGCERYLNRSNKSG